MNTLTNFTVLPSTWNQLRAPANPAFPIWALAAILVGLLLVLKPLGQIVHLATLPASALNAVLTSTAIARVVAVLLRLLPSSSRL